MYVHCGGRQSERSTEQLGTPHLPDADGQSSAREPKSILGEICKYIYGTKVVLSVLKQSVTSLVCAL